MEAVISDPAADRMVAIIGMSGRFPGASDVQEFWANLRDGVESMTQFSERELRSSGVATEALADHNFVPVGSVLEDIELFDADFFGINPREAESLDPQQRLFLETAWHALEDSGNDPDRFTGLVGVYGGCAMSSYLPQVQKNSDFMALLGHLQVYIGNEKDYLTSRVSYALNLKGPSFSIQTACSTSLLSVTLACDQLLSRQCDMALAGGVCVRVPQQTGYYHEPGGIYSPDGHCRVFDEQGAGIVFGNGVGIVVLKRLSDALEDGDSIYAVIRGWAVNNDGSGKASYAAPSLDGQADVIMRAHRMAGVKAETITYVEAHGTGTTVGDPIEVAALSRAFRVSTERRNFCAIGSVKSNVGHLDPAAGVAGLIKTALAIERKEIPPSINCHSPNPAIDFAGSPFYVNTELTKWDCPGGVRRAGVSAFGIGGTNVHVVLEEAPPRDALPSPEASKAPVLKESAHEVAGPHLLVLSARTASQLDVAIENLSDHLDRSKAVSPGDLAYTLQVGRKAWNHRAALVYDTVEEVKEALESMDPRRLLLAGETPRERAVSFLFSGQGSQYVNMARDLHANEPRFRSYLEPCFEMLEGALSSDVRRALFPRVGEEGQARAALAQTAITQPALFAIEYSLARLWMSWGVQPSSLIGHSIGEYVAACISGVFSAEDGLALVAERGRLMQGLPAGSMLAVPLSEQEMRIHMPAELDLAAVNEATSCVVSGPSATIDAFEKELLDSEISCRRLETSHAFHSAMMDPILEPFETRVRRIRLKNPCIPYISNVTGTWITTDEATSPDYWSRHLRQTVRFMDGLGELLSQLDRVLLEIGPGQTLSTFARRHPARLASQLVLSSLPHPQDTRKDRSVVLDSASRLWLAGVAIDWPELHTGKVRHRLHLPVYPYERRRYWAAESNESEAAEAAPIPKEGGLSDWLYTPGWKAVPNASQAKMNLGAASRCLAFVDDGIVAENVVAQLQTSGHHVIKVIPADEYRSDGGSVYYLPPLDGKSYARLFADLRRSRSLPQHIVHLWGLGNAWTARSDSDTPKGAPPLALMGDEDRGFYSLVKTAQGLAEARVNRLIDILAVTAGAHALGDDREIQPYRALVSAACRSIPQEYPNLRCRNVDFGTAVLTTEEPAAIARGIVSELDAEPAVVAAVRHGQRWIQVYDRLQIETPKEALGLLRRFGVYIITGGLGNIGLTLAEFLARAVEARLVLVGRSPFPEKREWASWRASEEPVAATIRRLRDIERHGADVLTVSADVADPSAMAAVIQEARARFGTVNGVIHGAGNVSPNGFFGVQEADRELCARQFRAKIAGTEVLAQQLEPYQLDFVLLLSSISSVLAGLGYVAYAAANTFLDAFAYKMSLSSPFPWISINLDAWEEEGKSLEVPDAERLAMTPGEGVEIIRRVLCRSGAPYTQVVVSTGDLQRRIDKWIDVESLRRARRRLEANSGLHPRPETDRAYVAPRSEVELQTAEMMQQLLGLSTVGAFDNFFTDLGGTSLLATQLIARLRERFRLDLPLRQLFEGPTIADLAASIELQRRRGPGMAVDEERKF